MIKSIMPLAAAAIIALSPMGVVTSKTAGGTLGSTSVTCNVDVRGGSSYSQAYLSISTGNIVEHLGINNINVITKNGGGTTGVSTSKQNSSSASYQGTAYAPNSISSVTGHFYVNSYNFGNFSGNYSY